MGAAPKDIGPELSDETLQAAIEVLEWFREQHGLMLSGLNVGIASPQAGVEARVLRVIRLASPNWVSRAELLRALGNVSAVDLDDPVKALVAAGTIERRSVKTASKPREEYALPTLTNSTNSNILLSDTNEKVRMTPTKQTAVSMPRLRGGGAA